MSHGANASYTKNSFFRSCNIVGKMSEFKFRWKTERERERRSKVCQFIEWFHGIKNRKNNKKILYM